jgi:hypothetical protein
MFRSDNFINVLIAKTVTSRSNAQTAATVMTSTGATGDAASTTPIRDGEILMFNGSTDKSGGTSAATNHGPSVRFVQGLANNRILASPVIHASDITKIVHTKAHAAASAQRTDIVVAVAPVKGETYMLRVTYTHDTAVWSEQQDIRTYFVRASAATVASLVADFVAKINADPASDILATDVGSTTIRLDGKALTFELGYFKNNIVTFNVSFDAALSALVTSAPTVTAASLGSGTYRQVAELEWFALGFEGIKNRMTIPIPAGRTLADPAAIYSTITVEFMLRDQYNVVSGAKPGKGILYMFFPDGYVAAGNANLQGQFTEWATLNGVNAGILTPATTTLVY